MGLSEVAGNAAGKVWNFLDSTFEFTKGILNRNEAVAGALQNLEDKLSKQPQSSEKLFQTLDLPQVYKNAVDHIIANKSGFNNATNLPLFLQALIDTGSLKSLSFVDADALANTNWPRSNDFEIVVWAIQGIKRIVDSCTPQSTEFNGPLRLNASGSSLILTVRQPDGSYKELKDSRVSFPQVNFKNLIEGIEEHSNGLAWWYEVINTPAVASTLTGKSDAATVAQELVQNPSGISAKPVAQA